MKVGIVGLPNVGKSTIFNAITNAGAASANYPFCTVDPNIGIVPVPDNRLEKLSKMYNSEKVTAATIEFVDIAGLVKGASKGEGLGNKFLANIREVDAVIHVVRCFENSNIIHVDGSVDPKRDIDTINIELILSDIEMAQKRIEKLKKLIKTDKSYSEDLEIWNTILNNLENEKPARAIKENDRTQEILSCSPLITAKPIIYVANVSEDDFNRGKVTNKYYKEVQDIAEAENTKSIPICAEMEAEISDMTLDEKSEFLNEIGLKESGLERIISSCYSLLGLISFLTAGKTETRAWTVKNGDKAPKAAGKIHSDMERGFIRAEVVSYNDLISCGSMLLAKEKGLVRSEGKEYIMKDGDIVLFRFNV